MREANFSQSTVRKQWDLVNEWFRDLEQDEAAGPFRLLDLVRRVMELGMSLKRQEHLTQLREAGGWDKANGYYVRQLDTALGSLPEVHVPRLRHGALPSSWFGRYRRRWTKVDHLLLNCLMGGLSTRTAVKIMSRHFHWSLSPASISRLTRHLEQALTQFRQAPLTDEYVGLIVDGAWYRFRRLYGPERVLLAVLGVKADGTVTLLAFHVARHESAVEIARVLRDLKTRGLHGASLRLIVGDGAGGIPAAAAEVYPWATFQLCCWHHLQTLKSYATDPVVARTLMREAAHCYHTRDLREVQRRLQAFLVRWMDRQTQAIEAFRSRLDQTLPYLSLPRAMHRWFRTTNYVERLFRDIRSRTKLIAAFDQPLHLERFVIGKVLEVNWINLPCDLQPLLQPDTII